MGTAVLEYVIPILDGVITSNHLIPPANPVFPWALTVFIGESVNATQCRGRPGLGPTHLLLQVLPTTVAGTHVAWVLAALFAGHMSQKCCSYLDDDDDDPEGDEQEIRDKTLPRWQVWLAAERSRDQRHWRPWRPDKTKKQTEEDCEDPERQASTPAQEGASWAACLLCIPTRPGEPEEGCWALCTCLAWEMPAHSSLSMETSVLPKTSVGFCWQLVMGQLVPVLS